MAEVENGSVNEPTQTSTALPQADNEEDAGDVIAHTDHPVDGDKAILPEESERQEIVTEESEDAHPSPEQLETAENTESPSQSAGSPEGAVASSPEPKPDPEAESKSKEDAANIPPETPAVNVEQQVPAERQDIGSIPPQDELASDTRMRSDSRSTTATFATHRSVTVSSTVFIVTALDAIGTSKEARRSKELDDAVKSALANVKQSDRQPIDPELIFRPLQLATKSISIPLQVTALDCIGKLITYSYFAFPSAHDGKTSDPEANPEQPPLIERAIDAICECFENEATPVEIQQQIIKSLLAAVLNDKIVVHGAGLLKAVRQIYNIFIYSKSSQNQQIAQGSLTQMVSTVFDRVQVRLDLKELRLRDNEKGQHSSSDTATLEAAETPQATEDDHESDAPSATTSDQPVTKEPVEKLTLQSFESSKDVTSVNDNAPTMVTRARGNQRSARSLSAASGEEIDGSAE